jgi:hypothetical protein
MDGLLIATGFTGALTLVWLFRVLYRTFTTPPSLEVRIGPAAGRTDLVLAELRRARREVIVMAPLLAHRPVAQALADVRLRRRANIEVLLGYQAERDPHSDLAFLLEQRIQPLVDSEHDPGSGVVIIIDRRTVLAGSWQLVPVADEREETLLIIKSHPEAVAQYVQNFLLHKAHTRPAALWPEAEPSAPPVVQAARLPIPSEPANPLPPERTEEQASRLDHDQIPEPAPIVPVIPPPPQGPKPIRFTPLPPPPAPLVTAAPPPAFEPIQPANPTPEPVPPPPVSNLPPGFDPSEFVPIPSAGGSLNPLPTPPTEALPEEPGQPEVNFSLPPDFDEDLGDEPVEDLPAPRLPEENPSRPEAA